MSRFSTSFEEFLKKEYMDEVFKILETYPDDKTLVVDYDKLEVFDPDLADFLIDKPETVIELAQGAIKNIDPLSKHADLSIKFENVTNVIPFEMLGSKYIGNLVVLYDVVIVDVKKPHPTLDIAVFECQGCMRLQKVAQYSTKERLTPSLCPECGGRSFRLLQEDSKFIEEQMLTVSVEGTSKKLHLFLYDDDCSYDKYYVGNRVSVTGVLKTCKTKKGFDYYFDCNYIVQLTSDVNMKELDSNDRNSPEYKNWQKTIIDKDQVCACCGGHKHLHAHHIFGYKNNPSYRLNIENGIALCKWCHGKYHSYYGKDANPKTLIEFLKRFGGK